MEGEKFVEVIGNKFFDLIERYAKKLITRISEDRSCVSYIEKSGNTVVGYILTNCDTFCKYYLNSNFELYLKKKI